MIQFKALVPGVTKEDLGLIPFFISPEDPRSAVDQIDNNYVAGWHSFKGHRLNDDNSLSYPGDPPTRPLAEARLRDELIVFYDHAWVAVIQPDRSFDVARID